MAKVCSQFKDGSSPLVGDMYNKKPTFDPMRYIPPEYRVNKDENGGLSRSKARPSWLDECQGLSYAKSVQCEPQPKLQAIEGGARPWQTDSSRYANPCDTSTLRYKKSIVYGAYYQCQVGLEIFYQDVVVVSCTKVPDWDGDQYWLI